LLKRTEYSDACAEAVSKMNSAWADNMVDK
jgi:hypothetical protein